jgi:hypothetical protein
VIGSRWRFIAPPLALLFLVAAPLLPFGTEVSLTIGVGAVLMAAGALFAASAYSRRRRRPNGQDQSGPEWAASPSSLIGRDHDLRKLVELHERLRDEQGDSSMTRPVIILLHGMAGVGKSVLATELGARIRPDYGIGPVTVNLHGAGEPPSTGHVLAAILRELKWKGPMPVDTTARVKIFRALAAESRPLIILDAVSDPGQLAGLIPNSAESGVIITSRRNFGRQLGIRSYPVRPLEPAASLDLLYAISRAEQYKSLACADPLVDMCGGLPVAIRSIGEQVVFEQRGLCVIYPTLKPLATRLRELTRSSTVAVDGIADEFGRLSLAERQALCLLTLPRTPTFASWVLGPLLNVTTATADLIITELANARLLEPAGRDARYPLPRYRFHPLVRLYAESWQNGNPDLLAACHAASHRLNTVFMAAAAELSGDTGGRSERSPQAGSEAATRWLPESPRDLTPEALDEWVRAELLSLAEAARASVTQDPALAVQICSLFGDRFPQLGEHLPPEWHSRLTITLDLCGSAARARNDLPSELDVRLAETSLQAATGHFTSAEHHLRRIDQILVSLPAPALSPAREQAARAYLALAQSYLHASWLEKAVPLVEYAHELDDAAPVLPLLRYVSDTGKAGATQPADYWSLLADARRREQERDWAGGISVLSSLLRQHATDLSRAATIQHRLAVLHWRRYQTEPRPDRLALTSRHAMRAATAAGRLADRWGVARNLLLLTETTMAAGFREEARKHLAAAADELKDFKSLPQAVQEHRRRLERMLA